MEKHKGIYSEEELPFSAEVCEGIFKLCELSTDKEKTLAYLKKKLSENKLINFNVAIEAGERVKTQTGKLLSPETIEVLLDNGELELQVQGTGGGERKPRRAIGEDGEETFW